MAETTNAIISIHRSYADAILEGQKTIELRRRIPNVPPGTHLWIYATKPTAAVIGVATITDVARAHPKTLWKRHRNGTGVDHASFKAYFNGAPQGVAIILAQARRIQPITIKQLRGIRESFHPPQVLTVLTAKEAKALRKLLRKSPAIVSALNS